MIEFTYLVHVVSGWGHDEFDKEFEVKASNIREALNKAEDTLQYNEYIVSIDQQA